MSLRVSNKLAVLLILLTNIIIVIDSNVINYFAFTHGELPVTSKLVLFTIFSIAIAILATLLLKNIQRYDSMSYYKKKKAQNFVRFFAIGSQFISITFLAIVIIQILLVNLYNSNLTFLTFLTSYASSILFIFLLIMLLAGWFRSNKNIMIMTYAASFSILCIYLIVSIVYVSIQFSYNPEWIRPKSIHNTMVNTLVAPLGLIFGPALNLLSLSSFVLLWIATLILLRQYRNKIGRTRYWIILIMPLIYFLLPFETYFANFAENMLSGSPVIFTITYLVIFSATEQVGSILFSIVFLTAATRIKQPFLNNSLIIAAVGLAIVFSSTDINSLLYSAYPPYGVLAILLMPLGTYSLYMGLFASARLVAQDKKLRMQLYQSAENQLDFLNTMGKVQMEKELEKNLKLMLESYPILEESKDDYRHEENVRELVEEVLGELQSRKIRDKK